MEQHPLSPVRISGGNFLGWALGPHTVNHTTASGSVITRRSAPAETMYRYRYQGDTSLLHKITERFTAALSSLFSGEQEPFNGLVMVPPPVSRADYTPVVALVSAISRHTGIPALQFAVQDSSPRPDAGAPRPQRRTFSFTSPAAASIFTGKHVLVLDDIYRSGRSLGAFCSLVRSAGAASITVMVGTLVADRSRQNR
ncbi:MAG: phosphoribosyltransferase [Chitinispirillaceae bacterium]|nr:phosphoribosyltransferase [Chitinispirillaceae bacterium]